MGVLDAPLVLNSRTRERLAGNKRTALRAFDAAMAGRNIDALFVGDSKTEGQRASAVGKRWLDQLCADWRAKYQPAGVTGGVGYIPAWYAAPFTATPSPGWTWTAGVNAAGQESGLGRRCAVLSAAGHQGTITVTCTSFKLFFTRHFTSSEAVTVSIDGGAATAVNITSSGTASLVRGGFTWTSPALTAGSHTIVVAWTSGASTTVEGGFFYNGDETAGIRVWDGAHSGYLASGFSTFSAPATNATWMPVISTVNPALIVNAFGTNDYRTGATSAQFAASMTALVAGERTFAPNASIVTLMMEEPSSVGQTPVEPYANFVNAAYLQAANDTGAPGGGSGITVLDLSTRMARSDLDTFGLHYADGLHFVDKGDRLVADIVGGFLAAG